MMIGFIFFAPLLGAAIGGATGAAVGKQKDVGVEDDFMDRLGVQAAATAAPRSSCSCAAARRRRCCRGSRSSAATVIQTSLDPETRRASCRRRSAARARPSELRRALAAHLGSRQVARVIYGAIIGLALLVVLEQHPPSDGAVAASLRRDRASRSGSPSSTARSSGTETRTRHRVGRRRARGVRRRRAGGRLRDQLPGRVLRARGARRPRDRHRVPDRALERARPDRLLRLRGGPAGGPATRRVRAPGPRGGGTRRRC